MNEKVIWTGLILVATYFLIDWWLEKRFAKLDARIDGLNDQFCNISRQIASLPNNRSS